MRINEIINEAAAPGQEIQYGQPSVEEAVNTLNTHCRDAIWMLQKGTPIWRGFPSKDTNALINQTGFSDVDPSQTERISQNTTNYYTIILDNIPSMKGFPKRSRSFIASTEFNGAYGYAYHRPTAIIPYDGVKIGSVNRQDMWFTKITIGDVTKNIHKWNYAWENLGLPESNNQPSEVKYKNFIAALKTKTAEEIRDAMLVNDLDGKQLAKMLNTIYGPEQTGFTVHTTQNLMPLMKGSRKELWIGGPCMLISLTMWDQLRAALAASKKSKKKQS
jgi:hypothetical protein